MANIQTLRGTIKKAGILTHSELPVFEVIDEFEVYLLDSDRNRLKRVCGCQKRDMPEGWLCQMSPGHNTDHSGSGFCSTHNGAIANSRSLSIQRKLNEKAGLPRNLLELLEHAETITDDQLSSVDGDIKFLYSLLQFSLSTRGIRFDGAGQLIPIGETREAVRVVYSEKEIKMMQGLVSKITSTKILRTKLERETSIDRDMVKDFVEQIFKIITANVDRMQAHRVMTAIVEEVITPHYTKGRPNPGEVDDLRERLSEHIEDEFDEE